MAPPSPPWIDDGSSPMMAPTTLAGAEIFSAVNRYGIEAGIRASTGPTAARRVGVHQLVGPGIGERRPRSVLMVTGKKVR